MCERDITGGRERGSKRKKKERCKSAFLSLETNRNLSYPFPAPSPEKPPPLNFLEFIAASPLLPSTGLSLASIAANLPEWISLSRVLADSLGFDSDRSSWTEPQRSRVFQYYLPVFFWVRAQLEDKKAREIAGSGAPSSEPLVVGIQAPQGCGKTTLVAELETLLASVGLRAASVSVDDFYLTFAGQQRLAAEHAGNPLLELRGNAGSHDLALGSETLERLVKGAAGKGGQEQQEVALPRYDKSLNGGRGDRAPAASWPVVRAPVDVVLFEGWMLGFRPVGAARAAEVSPHLPAVDSFLEKYAAAWDSRCDSWLMVRASNGPQCVYSWRLQAERQLREASGGKGMSDEQVKDFVDRFLPAYEAYLPGAAERGPPGSRKGRVLVVGVEDDRSLSRRQPGPPTGLE